MTRYLSGSFILYQRRYFLGKWHQDFAFNRQKSQIERTKKNRLPSMKRGVGGFCRAMPKCRLVLRAGIEPARLTAGDFKSAVKMNVFNKLRTIPVPQIRKR